MALWGHVYENPLQATMGVPGERKITCPKRTKHEGILIGIAGEEQFALFRKMMPVQGMVRDFLFINSVPEHDHHRS